MSGVSISVSDDSCAEEVRDSAVASLRRHTETLIGPLKLQGHPFGDNPITVLAFKDDKLVGGVLGTVFYKWLYIDLVWVEERLRGEGIGTEVMKAAEQHARDRKLIGIYLWTESWQAPLFYAKLGYEQFVEFKNCPPGHSRFGYRKYLV